MSLAKKKQNIIPKTTLDFIPFEDVWNNFIYLDNGKIIGGIKVKSINFHLMFIQEQCNKIEEYKSVLNKIDYPIKMISLDKNISLDGQVDYLNNKINMESNKGRKQLLEEDLNYLNSLKHNEILSNKEFYFLVEEDKDNERLLTQKLNDLVREFNAIGLFSEVVESEEWREIIYMYLNPLNSVENFKNDSLSISKTFKERVAPMGIKINDKEMMVGDAWISVVSIITYPTNVMVGWAGDIVNIPNTRMTMTLTPMDTFAISNTLKKSISEIRTKLINVSDYNDQILYNNQLSDLMELVNRIDREHERFSMFMINFFCYEETKEKLERVKRQVKATLNSYGIIGETLIFEQEQAYKMCLPTLERSLENQYGRVIPMLSIASGFPFIFQTLQDDKNSMVIGRDNMNSLVTFDLWKRTNKRNNSNAVIIGKSGYGKSTLLKKLIRGNYARGTKVIILDCEREYRDMCLALGGSWIDCGSATSGIINPLEVKRGADNSDEDVTSSNDLSKHLQSFRTFLKYYCGHISEYVSTEIEEILTKVYADKGITFDTDISTLKSDDYPIMKDLYNAIKNRLSVLRNNQASTRKIDELDEICSIIKRMVYGADAKLFNGISSINNDKDLIVLDINSLIDINGNLFRAQFFNILSWAWNEMSRNRKEKVMLVVDEAHLLIDTKNPEGIDFLKRAVKRSRKYDGSIVVSSQNLIDFCAKEIERYGQVIIDNSTYMVLLAQGQKEIDAVQKMVNLTEPEVQYLLTAKKGQGLFMVNRDLRLAINIKLRNEESKLFGDGGGR